MATGVDAKLLKSTKFPPEFSQKVDMTKVNLQVVKKWIAGKISEILGSEDDVVIELCFNLIEGSRYPDIKSLQIQLTGFLDKDTAPFCKELSRPTKLPKKPARDERSLKPAVAEGVVASTATVVAEATETHTVVAGEASGVVVVPQGHRRRPGEEPAIITADPPVGAIHTCLAIDALHGDGPPRRTLHRLVPGPAHPARPAVDAREDATPLRQTAIYARGRGLRCPERTTTALADGRLPLTGTHLRPSAGVTLRLEVAHLLGGGVADHSRRLARTGGLCHVHEAQHAGDVTETVGAGAVPLAVLVESGVEEDAS
ncbi:hypothetical protein INS49_010173 [Diaporthe citri]|uniref:uncharacterized protein n=1 Tax=Diaporthe citri TaxID=83186 RepID=UPI001C818CD2|nr:uncharacterized protein INS49_010173 [Diaporthe citri]KAG6361944.1 hypothetical protein INS49_010173 [Diaporthe citri]